jgi:hypothetical protein
VTPTVRTILEAFTAVAVALVMMLIDPILYLREDGLPMKEL